MESFQLLTKIMQIILNDSDWNDVALVIFDDDVIPGAAAAEDPSAVDGWAAVSILPDAGSGDSGDVSLPHWENQEAIPCWGQQLLLFFN